MIKTYFKDIRKVILNNFSHAHSTILIAVSWFTDEILFEDLLQLAKKGVSITIVINHDEINLNSKLDFVNLIQHGGSVHLYQKEDFMMHHKFCIIDSSILITGSYNWTKRASLGNTENILVLTGKDASIEDFKKEFEILLIGSVPLIENFIEEEKLKHEDILTLIQANFPCSTIILPSVKKGKYGMVNYQLEVIIPFIFDYCSIFYDDWTYLYFKNNLYLISINGSVYYFENTQLLYLNSNFAMLSTEGKNKILTFDDNVHYINPRSQFYTRYSNIEQYIEYIVFETNIAPLIFTTPFPNYHLCSSDVKEFTKVIDNAWLLIIKDKFGYWSNEYPYKKLVNDNGEEIFPKLTVYEVLPIDGKLFFANKSVYGCYALFSRNKQLSDFIYDPFYFEKFNDYNPLKVVEDLIQVERSGKMGFVSIEGKEQIPCQYYTAENFSEDLAAVESIEGWIYIDKSGKRVINQNFKRAYSFSEGLAFVVFNYASSKANYDDEEYFPFGGYIDKKGKIIIQANSFYGKEFHEGCAVVYKYFSSSTRIDNEKVEQEGNSYNGSPVQYYYKLFGYINTDGQLILPFKLAEASEFKYGYARVFDIAFNKYCFVDTSGKYLSINASRCKPLNKSFFKVSENDKEGLINNSGDEILPIEYDNIIVDSHGHIIAIKESDTPIKVVIDTNNNILLEQ